MTFSGEEFLDWLYTFNEQFNADMPTFELLNNIINNRNKARKKAVCPMAFVDFEVGTLVDLEDACNNYHVLPYNGGLLDQPQLLLEVFNVVRAEKERYKSAKAEKMLADAKSKNK